MAWFRARPKLNMLTLNTPTKTHNSVLEMFAISGVCMNLRVNACNVKQVRICSE